MASKTFCFLGVLPAAPQTLRRCGARAVIEPTLSARGMLRRLDRRAVIGGGESWNDWRGAASEGVARVGTVTCGGVGRGETETWRSQLGVTQTSPEQEKAIMSA